MFSLEGMLYERYYWISSTLLFWFSFYVWFALTVEQKIIYMHRGICKIKIILLRTKCMKKLVEWDTKKAILDKFN